MALQNLVGQGLWVPSMNYMGVFSASVLTTNDNALLDADAEEYQMIGDIYTDDGASHVFGNSGAAVEWMPGAITFNAVSTLRVGIKQASSIDAANGPPIRATAGLVAFDVYKDLVAGVDTITTATAQSTAMATLTGSAITIADGDQCAICFYLTKASGTSSVTVRQAIANATNGYPGGTLITSSASVFTAQAHLNSVMLKFDDGHYGWIFPTIPQSAADASVGAIGNTNIWGNVIRVPYACKLNALAAVVNPSSSAANFALDVYSTPLGTPSQVATVAFDANESQGTGALRLYMKRLASPPTLAINNDYVFGARQTTATGVNINSKTVFATGHWQAYGNGAECYAAKSVAGATFSQQSSGLLRYAVWGMISALSDNVGSGGGAGQRVIGG